MSRLNIKARIRENPLGTMGLALACLALISLRLPINVTTALTLGTTILIATFASLILCTISLVREKNKVFGFLGILAILVGETYKLPIILMNAFALLVTYLPYIFIVVLVVTIALYLYRRFRRATR